MKDYFTQPGFEAFSDRVADKVIERSSDKIAGRVVEKIKPVLARNAAENTNVDSLLTRKETAQLLKVSEPTLRRLYNEGTLKAYGTGIRMMRFNQAEVITAPDSL